MPSGSRSGPDPGGYADLSQFSLSYFMDVHGPPSLAAAPATLAAPWIARLRPGGIHGS